MDQSLDAFCAIPALLLPAAEGAFATAAAAQPNEEFRQNVLEAQAFMRAARKVGLTAALKEQLARRPAAGVFPNPWPALVYIALQVADESDRDAEFVLRTAKEFAIAAEAAAASGAPLDEGDATLVRDAFTQNFYKFQDIDAGIRGVSQSPPRIAQDNFSARGAYTAFLADVAFALKDAQRAKTAVTLAEGLVREVKDEQRALAQELLARNLAYQAAITGGLPERRGGPGGVDEALAGCSRILRWQAWCVSLDPWDCAPMREALEFDRNLPGIRAELVDRACRASLTGII